MVNMKISEEVADYLIRADFCADPAFACTSLTDRSATVYAEQAMTQARTKGAEYYLLNGSKIKYSGLKNYGWYIVEIDTSANSLPVPSAPACAPRVEQNKSPSTSHRRTREEMVGKKLLILIDEVLKNAYDAGIYKLEHRPSLVSAQRYRYVGSRKDILALLRGPYAMHFLDYEDSSLSNAISIRVRCRGVAPTA
jgi:hypothetical protein